MKKLEEHQISQIKQLIEKYDFVSEDMKDDLLDHVICAIEDSINQGVEFQDALEKATANIFLQNSASVKSKRILLSLKQSRKKMKLWIWICVIISIFLFVYGTILKLKHLSGSHEFIIAGLIMFFSFNLPLITYYLFRNNITSLLKYRNILILTSFVILIFFLGAYLKLSHRFGAEYFICIPLLIFSLIVVPKVFFKSYRVKGNHTPK